MPASSCATTRSGACVCLFRGRTGQASSGQVAHEGRGEKDCGQHRQATEAAEQVGPPGIPTAAQDDKMKARYLKAKIKRLKSEISEIDDYFYMANEHGDQVLYAGMLEHKRDDIVRSTVLQLHTAIEDLLDCLIIDRMLGVTEVGKRSNKLASRRGRSLLKMLHGGRSIGFDTKLNLASTIGLLNGKGQKSTRGVERDTQQVQPQLAAQDADTTQTTTSTNEAVRCFTTGVTISTK